MEKAENSINIGGLLLLNKLTNWLQLGLILKSCVCSLKWAQVEVNCSIRLGETVIKVDTFFENKKNLPLPIFETNWATDLNFVF